MSVWPNEIWLTQLHLSALHDRETKRAVAAATQDGFRTWIKWRADKIQCESSFRGPFCSQKLVESSKKARWRIVLSFHST